MQPLLTPLYVSIPATTEGRKPTKATPSRPEPYVLSGHAGTTQEPDGDGPPNLSCAPVVVGAAHGRYMLQSMTRVRLTRPSGMRTFQPRLISWS